MRPKKAGSATDTRAADSGFDTWRALQGATDTKRANLIADIVGHPHDSTTVEELDTVASVTHSIETGRWTDVDDYLAT